MPLPRWLARLNRRMLNDLEMRRGDRPVLEHIGRTSGSRFATPLDAHEVQGGFVFVPLYGPRTDWLLNVLAHGTAVLRRGEETILLENPRPIAIGELTAGIRRPPGWLGVTEAIRMDVGG